MRYFRENIPLRRRLRHEWNNIVYHLLGIMPGLFVILLFLVPLMLVESCRGK